MTPVDTAGARLEPCDRADIVIQRAINCGWITVKDREQLRTNIRIALDTEVEAGGPYLNNGWNRRARPAPDAAILEALDRLGSMEAFLSSRTIKSPEDDEMIARIEFAQRAAERLRAALRPAREDGNAKA